MWNFSSFTIVMILVVYSGIEVMANRFSVIQTQIKKKPYDFLDQRKQEFTQDYEDFQRQTKELHVSLGRLLCLAM